MKQLMTPWGEKIYKERQTEGILSEYPRPQMVRDSYFNLNGLWEIAFSEDEHKPGVFDRQILVPFSPESLLSGVQEQLKPGQWLHYRRKFILPEGFWKDRVLLHFGAVDQECKVYVNGKLAGSHLGGYNAFSLDITDDLCEGENELMVSVQDQTEKSPHARGKQKLKKKGMMSYLFYTAQSGIWQTVWMESVPNLYIDQLRILPKYDEACVQIDFWSNRSVFEMLVDVIILADGVEVRNLSESDRKQHKAEHYRITMDLPDFRAWSPEDPFLYDMILKFGEDEIHTYFGMRKVSVGKDQKEMLRFMLNNKPFFYAGVLDQGYWPESLMTAPSDEALLYDLQKIKAMGFNTVRKHVKVESDRFYYHCDRLGLMVWQDMPNGGGEYNMTFVTYLPNISDSFQRHVKDNDYVAMKRLDAAGRRQYYTDLKGMVRQLFNHPCIAAWVPFNEGWGQFSADKATALIRKNDPSRLVNEACGWFDQGGGDIYSIHNYMHKLRVKPQKDRVVALTECGGYAYAVEDHVACKRRFGYKTYESMDAFRESYKALIEDQVMPHVANGLSGMIYTQTSDIEEETNGLMTYDRQITKFDEAEMAAINRRLIDSLK